MTNDFKYLTKVFVIRTISLLPIFFIAQLFLKLQKDFLGGDIPNYIENPFMWSFANFDGVHYLSIAEHGYKELQYFFFPLFPLLIRLFSFVGDKTLLSYLIFGIFISNMALLISLIGLFLIVRDEYNLKVAKWTVILLLLFPTSFYLHTVYTESLFLALVVWSFYFMKKRNWILASILVSLASATRLIGLALMCALLVEIIIDSKDTVSWKLQISKLIALLVSPIGLLSYLYFLWIRTGDPFEFLHNVGIYGEQRSSHLIMLPQVFYRYIFKILPNINYSYFPVVFTTWLEFTCALLFGGLVVIGIVSKIRMSNRFQELKRLKWSYLVYLVIAYVIPTLSGSFSSFPRYVLALFPGFIIGSIIFLTLHKYTKAFIILFLSVGFVLAYSLFLRGYWVS